MAERVRDGGGTSQGCGEGHAFDLSKHVLFEVLKRVDPVTLAVAGCVNNEFRSVAEEEGIWETLCNERWPSTKASEVKSVLDSVGGYRKLYARCYPSIVSNRGFPAANPIKEAFDCNHHEQELEGGRRISPSDFISMVDVAYGDQSLFCRTVEGFPGAEGDLYAWFSKCAFQVHLLRSSGTSNDQDHDRNTITIDLPFVPSRSSLSNSKRGSERDRSRLWRALCDELRVSWILIDKEKKLMANLASWRPLGGHRHWLCDDQFLLRFGSVLPGAAFAANNDSTVGEAGGIQCNISAVCSVSFVDMEAGETAKATLKLTELSLQLEDSAGALANGEESIAILRGALSCSTSTNRQNVLDSYNRYQDARNKLKARNIRDDARLNVAAAIAGGVSLCLSISWIMGYWS